jgi:hypothetical protein
MCYKDRTYDVLSTVGMSHLTNRPQYATLYEMTTRTQASHKNTDSKGRVTLGGRFANRAVIVEQRSDDEVVVRLARVIPEREVWLYKNPKALASVRRGLEQARKGDVAENSPDLKASAKLAKQLED